MPFNIFGVLEEIKNEYDVNTEERKALSIIENRLYENEKLKQQLEIATKFISFISKHDVVRETKDFNKYEATFLIIKSMAFDILKQIEEIEQ